MFLLETLSLGIMKDHIMNKSMKIVAISAMALMALSAPLQPIKESSVPYISAVTSAATGIGAGLVAANNKCSDFTIAAVIGGVAGATNWVMNALLNKFTPSGRYARAISVLYQAGAEGLFDQEMTHQSHFINAIQCRYFDSNWPLVRGYHYCSRISKDLRQAIDLVIAAKNETHKIALRTQCDKLKQELHKHFYLVQNQLRWITSHPEYARQYKMYQLDQQIAIQQAQLDAMHEARLDKLYARIDKIAKRNR